MDSQSHSRSAPPTSTIRLPDWARPRATGEADAAFAAGAGLHALDGLVRAEPRWAGVWRQRLALAAALHGVRLSGRNEEEAALRDALLLKSESGHAGPAGNIHIAFKRLTQRQAHLGSREIAALADLLGLAVDDRLSDIPALVDEINQMQRAAPFAAAAIVEQVMALRPDAELLAWWLADWMLASALHWQRPLPLLISQRYGTAFRSMGGRGRVRPGEPGFARCVCLAIVDASAEALRIGDDLSRRAERLLAVAPRLRTKGADKVVQRLLEEDALLATAPGISLSRWAASRLFDRLSSFDAVRELSGRDTFRIFGL